VRLLVVIILSAHGMTWAANTEPVRDWQRTQAERHTCQLSLMSSNESHIERHCPLEGQ
jgi:hypothetical protein